MNIKVTPYHFEELITEGYTLDQVFLLRLVKDGYDVQKLCDSTPRLEAICQSIYRKGLVSDHYKLTKTGKTLLEFMDSRAETSKILKKLEESSTEFDRWWKAYPGTDVFTYKGKSFTGTRTLRVSKEDCLAKLSNILSEGEYTIDELIAALEYEVLQKKENSVKLGVNKLTYMQGSATYLTQRTFEAFVELIREGKTVVEESTITGGTDI
jgi:hypothetical protein